MSADYCRFFSGIVLWYLSLKSRHPAFPFSHRVTNVRVSHLGYRRCYWYISSGYILSPWQACSYLRLAVGLIVGVIVDVGFSLLLLQIKIINDGVYHSFPYRVTCVLYLMNIIFPARMQFIWTGSSRSYICPQTQSFEHCSIESGCGILPLQVAQAL